MLNLLSSQLIHITKLISLISFLVKMFVFFSFFIAVIYWFTCQPLHSHHAISICCLCYNGEAGMLVYNIDCETHSGFFKINFIPIGLIRPVHISVSMVRSLLYFTFWWWGCSFMDRFLLMSSELVLDFQTNCNITYGCVWIESHINLIVSISVLVR